MHRRPIVIPSGCAACASSTEYDIWLPGRRISKREHYSLFGVIVDIGVCLTSWVLPPTITSSRNKSCHNSMRRRRIIIPSGCAECAAPTLSAHPLARSVHLEMRTALAFYVVVEIGVRLTHLSLAAAIFPSRPLVSLPTASFPPWPPSFPRNLWFPSPPLAFPRGRHLSLTPFGFPPLRLLSLAPFGFPPLRLLSLAPAIFPSRPLVSLPSACFPSRPPSFPRGRHLSLAPFGFPPPACFPLWPLGSSSAKLERLQLLAFLSCCGARGASDLLGSPFHQLMSLILP
jgi:hypothetical protein